MSSQSSDSKSGFMQSLGGIRRLEQDKFNVYAQKPKMGYRVKTPSVSEHVDPAIQAVSHTLPGSINDSWFHHGLQKKLQRKIRMGQLTIDALLDLHGYRQQEARLQLEQFLQHALEQRARMVLIIHGQGFRSQSASVLRPLAQHWLSEQAMVLAYCPAQPRDGGIGASYVYLKSLTT